MRWAVGKLCQRRVFAGNLQRRHLSRAMSRRSVARVVGDVLRCLELGWQPFYSNDCLSSDGPQKIRGTFASIGLGPQPFGGDKFAQSWRYFHAVRGVQKWILDFGYSNRWSNWYTRSSNFWFLRKANFSYVCDVEGFTVRVGKWINVRARQLGWES